MEKPAAITAMLVDVRNVATHKSVRMEIHVPEEQAGEVIKAFGWPTMVNPVHVAIARLDLSKAKEPAPKEKRPLSSMPLSQQCAIKCNDPQFRNFLESRLVTGEIITAAMAAELVRDECQIQSRSELDSDPDAAMRWRRIDDHFWAWQRGIE